MEEDENISMTTYSNLLNETQTLIGDYYDYDYIIIPSEVIVTTSFWLFILIFVGMLGNLMTIIAFFEDKKRNQVYDFFLLNLAITDLIVCCICMPFHTTYIVEEFMWPFEQWLCKIWFVIEFTATTQATLLMLILSFDRLLMISLGTLYMQKMTWKVGKSMLVISWIISFVHNGPAIIVWEYFSENTTLEHGDCDVDFANDSVFIIIMTLFEFVIPILSLTIINGILFYKIRSWANKRQQINKNQSVMDSMQISQISTVAVPVTRIGSASDNSNGQTRQPPVTYSDRRSGGYTTSKAGSKSSKFLATLVLVFLICWLPYEITTVISSVCYDCVNWMLYEYLILLLLFKSVVNPFLYALNSPRYRRCFQRYLTLNGRLWKAGRSK